MSDNQSRHSTWVTVDLSVIKDNIRLILEHTGVQVMAIVKANAYGHGAVPVAQAALEAGAAWCGVARVNEALELRQSGLVCPLLLLGYTPEARYEEMIQRQISMTVWNHTQVETISAVALRINQEARLHLKVDTGMGRLGADPEEIIRLCQLVAQLPNIAIEGLFTHFARADEADSTPTDAQEKIFLALVAKLDAAGFKIQMTHAANSAASLAHPKSYFNCVRIGVAMYGLHPSPECPLPTGFQPALMWKSVLESGQNIAIRPGYQLWP